MSDGREGPESPASYRADDILRQLDDCARQYEFPMLDNVNVHLCDVRLTAYRDSLRWALVVETLVFNPGGGRWNQRYDCVSDALYRFGNCLRRSPGLASDSFVFPVSDPEEDKIFEDDFTIRPTADHITIRNEKIPLKTQPPRNSLQPTLGDSGALMAWELLRSLTPQNRRLLLATDDEIRTVVPPDLPSIITLDEWHHPTLSTGELPSQTETFRMLADVLVAGDHRLYQPRDKPNTHWTNWLPHEAL